MGWPISTLFTAHFRGKQILTISSKLEFKHHTVIPFLPQVYPSKRGLNRIHNEKGTIGKLHTCVSIFTNKYLNSTYSKAADLGNWRQLAGGASTPTISVLTNRRYNFLLLLIQIEKV